MYLPYKGDEMEKVKQNVRVYAFVIVALALVSIGLGVALYFNSRTMSSRASSLESVYQKSLYELIDSVNSMEVEVSKLIVTNDSKSTKQSLTTIKQQSADAQNALSYLPVSSNFVSEANKFVNQLNGYTTSLLKGDSLNFDDKTAKSWEDIYDCLASLKYELNKLSLKISQGYSILDNLDSGNSDSGFSQNFSGITSDSLEYPSMIYDGPFSDSVLNKEVKGLPDTTCTEDEAKDYIKSCLKDFNIKEIKYVGETKGKFTTYNFSVTAMGGSFYVQVTKQGKFLLNINGNASNSAATISQEDAVKLAEDFAKSIGLENMKSVWEATSENITYVNLAPVVSGVIYYPDLIKVKISLSNGYIMGWEASNYAYNHENRKSQTFTKAQNDILSNLSNKISVKSVKKCIIPLEYSGEASAYEVCGKYNNFTYYLYFDSISGEQIKVLRVIQTSNGDLLL